MNGPTRTAAMRAKSAASTMTLIIVVLLLAMFPFIPIQLLRKQRDDGQEQEVRRELDE